MFWPVIHVKAKQDQGTVAVVFCLIYCVNEFLTDFMRRLKSSDRLHVHVNENNMFRCPLRLLKKKPLVTHTRNLGTSERPVAR